MTQLNRRERKAAQLLKHYETCERLGKYLGMEKPDGKKISVALLKIERDAHNAATAQCNGEAYNGQPFRSYGEPSAQAPGFTEWEYFVDSIKGRISKVLSQVPPAFFLNADARGYALKIDSSNRNGQELIEAVKLHTDWGGYGILSPEINGN